MSGRPRRRQSGTGPASPAQQEEVGEGELARVLAAVEALTSQVGDISTAVQQQHADSCSPRHRLSYSRSYPSQLSCPSNEGV